MVTKYLIHQFPMDKLLPGYYTINCIQVYLFYLCLTYFYYYEVFYIKQNTIQNILILTSSMGFISVTYIPDNFILIY